MSLSCPSCWASLDFSVWMLSNVCNYCKTILLIDRWVYVNTWEKTFIMPFPTIFKVWKYFYAIQNNSSNDTILWKKVLYVSEEEFKKSWQRDFLLKIYISGQIRYVSDGWFFDDYFIKIIDSNLGLDINKNYTLTENEWLIVFSYVKNIYTDISQEIFESPVWTICNNYFLQEQWKLNLEWFEWSFPFLISSKDVSKYVILLKDWKQTSLKSIGNDVIEYIWI